MSKKPEALFDKRIYERNINTGRITQKEWDAHVKKLQDARTKSTSLFDERDSGGAPSGEPDGEPK